MRRSFIAAFIMVAVLACSLYARTVQVYLFKGNYVENRDDTPYDTSFFMDHVRYQFYENEDSERIFDGYFRVNKKNQKIKGYYKNNFKDGKWYFYDNTRGSTTVTRAVYSKGKLNGKCSVIRKDNRNRKVLFSSTAYFKNNIMVGKYKYNDTERNISIEINFDDRGYYDGLYKVRFFDRTSLYEDKRTYENGVIRKRILRNVNNGKIIYKFKNGKIKDLTDDVHFYREEEVQEALNYWVIKPYRDIDGYEIGSSYINLIKRGINIDGFNRTKVVTGSMEGVEE